MEHNNAGSTANMRTPCGSEQLSQKQQQQQQQQAQHHQIHHHHQQQQHHQHHHSQSPQISSQQQSNEHQQQFCLRWHNHQTSLLSTLPILLDQSHLTDVTISAEGRTLRAHRVVLSACSSFFLEIFRTLDNTHHPVIIIPGASFQAIVALLTFMYSGEVNVYEEQIPTLLSLAETLGIKGLADVHNNLQKSHKPPTKDSEEPEKSLTPPTPPPSSSSQATSGNFTIPQPPVQQPTQPGLPATSLPTSPFSPLLNPVLNSKFPSPLENFFLKSLQFYPNLMHQPLNFSQTALNKTSEILAKYQQQCNLYQANLAMNSKDLIPLLHNSDESHRSVLSNDDLQGAKRFCTGLEKKAAMPAPQMCGQNPMTAAHQKDIKRIDKIVENLRGSTGGSCGLSGKLSNHDNNNGNTSALPPSHLQNQLSPLSIKTTMDNYAATTSPLMPPKSSLYSSPTTAEPNSPLHHPQSQLGFNISAEDQLKLQQHLDKYAASCAAAAVAAGNMTSNDNAKQESRGGNDKLTTPQSPQNKAPSSKLYATCFICHKQLSNQYNLRVHLETHQNVRYACNVCSHVSRSKDALRKHVSYRHPGAPSPCETEARRKRANKLLASSLNASAAGAVSANVEDMKTPLPNTPPALQQSFQANTTSAGLQAAANNERMCNEQMLPATPLPQQQFTAAQLNSAYQMFLPNQFHLAAATAVQQHLRESQQSQSPTTSTPTTITPTTTPTKELSASFPAAIGNVQNNLPRSSSPPLALGDVTKSTTTTNNTTNSPTPTPTPELVATPNSVSAIGGEARTSPTTTLASP